MSALYFYDRVAARTLALATSRADHPSIPDGSQPRRQSLRHMTTQPPGSSSSYSKSASPDQRFLSGVASSVWGIGRWWKRTPAHVVTDIALKENHRR